MFPRFKNTNLTMRMSDNVVLKLVLIFGSIFGVFLMTGLLYFRNDVEIIDEGVKRTVYTVSADPYEILRENHIDVSPYDKIEFTGFEGRETAVLTIDRAFEVAVYTDGEQTSAVYNTDGTVSELCERFGIDLGKYDKVTPSLDSVVTEGEEIRIEKAFEVKITADGKTVSVMCNDNTANELLERAEIKIDEDDLVSVSRNKVITESCEITVSRVEKKVKITEEVTPYETKNVADNLMVIGTSEVRTEGVDGVVQTIVTDTYIDGVKKSTSTETKVVSEKVDEVIAEGAAVAEPYCKKDDPAIVLENGRPVNYEYIISGKATAYTAPAGAYTASGRLAEIGTCAVNPNQIPYGSLVYIVGQNNDICYGYAIAADTGEGMMDGTIPVDVYMGDRENHFYDSCDWGLQYVDIYVIEVGNG